jgi:hypothetical protein
MIGFTVWSVAKRPFADYPILDYLNTLTLRGLNVFYPYFSKANLTTALQSESLLQASRLSGVYSEYAVLSNRIHTFAMEYIPEFVVRSVRYVPMTPQEKITFKASISPELQRIKTQILHLILTPENIVPIINIQHVVLLNIERSKKITFQVEALAARLIRSVALSIKNHETVQKALPAGLSEENRMIARLDLYKKNRFLPKGLPDPDVERLQVANLQEKMDKALDLYLDSKLRKLLMTTLPDHLKEGVFGLGFNAIGQGIMMKIVLFALREYGFKQCADPHKLFLGVYKALGKDSRSFDLEGFGRGQQEKVVQCGRSLLKAYIDKRPIKELDRIIDGSGLMTSRFGVEALHQKKEAKEELHQALEKAFYELIKPEGQTQNTWGDLRKRAQSYPFLGSASLVLHGVLGGALFSLQYFAKKKGVGETYSAFMFDQFKGHALSEFLAKYVVQVLEMPFWPFLLLDALDALFEELQTPSPPPSKPLIDELDGELKTICTFFVKMISPHLSDVSFIYDKEAVKGLLGKLSLSRDPTPTLNVVSSLLEEQTLAIRLVEEFRKFGLHFEGDNQLWEWFLQSSFDLLATVDARKHQKPFAQSRQEFVAKYFAMPVALVMKELCALTQEDLERPIASPAMILVDTSIDYQGGGDGGRGGSLTTTTTLQEAALSFQH